MTAVREARPAVLTAAARSAGAAWGLFRSLRLTIACLALLMALVVLCTMAQVRLGTFQAVDVYIRTLFVMWETPGGWKIPVFPGGGLVGLVLLLNLAAAQFGRLERSWRKAGIWLIHIGLVLLFVGEFVTGLFQVETQLAFEEGQYRNFAEEARAWELSVVDASEPAYDQVYAVPQSRLRPGAVIAHADWPFSILVKRHFRNSELERRAPQDEAGSLATAGLGKDLIAFERPPVSRDDESDRPSAFIELFNGDRSFGSFLVSAALDQEQEASAMGRSYRLALRPARRYLPFTLKLLDFRHEKHPGTEIPRHFSSRVRLLDPARSEERDLLISMNEPLRYRGRTFYQASFGKDDTLSVLQIVRNPGWLLPYAACLLVASGLLWHFGARLRRAAA